MSQPASIGNVDMEDVEPQQQQGAAKAKGGDEVKSEEPSAGVLSDLPKEGSSVEVARPMRIVAHAKYTTNPAWFHQLAKLKADNFTITGEPKDAPIWICNRDDKINDVLNGMIKRNILSVPVLLKTQKYFGFIDLMDVVRYVVQHFGSTEMAKERSFLELLKEEHTFGTKTVADLMEAPLTLRNPYHPISSGYSAFAVVEALARERGLHRVPVVDANRHMLNLVTQSQVVRWLAENVASLGAINEKTINDCKRVYKEVLTVTEDTTAIDAFNLMVTNNVQGIAIVNDDKRLRGNLSLRDLKIVGPDLSLFWRLHQTVKNFVIKLRAEFSARHGRPRQVVYVTPSSTIKEVIEALAKHQIHRLYICNNHQKKQPIGVISLQDLLLEIIDS